MAEGQITVADVVSEFGDYYLGNDAHATRLHKLIKQKTVLETIALPMVIEGTREEHAVAELSEVLQGFQDTWTKKGNLTFSPNPIDLKNVKIDLEFPVHKLKSNWLGFLANLESDDVTEWPFVRWFFEEMYASRLAEDREKKAHYGGKYVTPIDGTPSAAADSMDGVQAVLQAGVDAEKVNIVTSAITPGAATMFDFIEDITDNIPEELESENLIVLMPSKWQKWYYRDDRNTNGGNQNYNAANPVVQFSDLSDGEMRLLGVPGMAGTDQVIITPRANFYHVKNIAGQKTPMVDKEKRNLIAFTDWYEGFWFPIFEQVYVYGFTATGSGSGS